MLIFGRVLLAALTLTAIDFPCSSSGSAARPYRPSGSSGQSDWKGWRDREASPRAEYTSLITPRELILSGAKTDA
jgi:hypothetical protein